MTMKPAVFLSHSSRDQEVLTDFKAILQKKTSNSVQFFLSSDGQSIPLGRNWVHRIEQALDDAKLMIVFLSPSSVRSQWVFFESGYAFAKGVRVVPVGVLGFDLNELRPPLSLMQGFNIRGADGMNNVIALLNEQFELSCNEDIAQAEFDATFGRSEAADAPSSHRPDIEKIQFLVPGAASELIAEVKRSLVTRQLDYHDSGQVVTTFGAVFRAQEDRRPGITGEFDPPRMELIIPVLDDVSASRTDHQTGLLTVLLREHVRIADEAFKRTSRLYGSSVSILMDGKFALGSTIFAIDRVRQHRFGGPTVYGAPFVTFDVATTVAELPYVINVLFDRGVFWIDPLRMLSPHE